MPQSYYEDKRDVLSRLFGCDDLVVEPDVIVASGRRFAVIEDVIVALSPDHAPASIRSRLERSASAAQPHTPFAPDVQRGFGAEWQAHPEILPEHEREFAAYFDLVALDSLAGTTVGDLGCGSGRWATFLAAHCAHIVCVDYSDAIFVARRNLRHDASAVFVMADVLDLPFTRDAFDFAYCLGVLHHLPVDALKAVRTIARYAPRLLVYVYYALDNRPAYFRLLLGSVTAVRTRLASIRSARWRRLIAGSLAVGLYLPVSLAGRVLRPLGADRWLPLAETYTGKSLRRLRQDAYDRFFTRIEQRFSRSQILDEIDAATGSVTVSPSAPYWHFLVERAPDAQPD